MEQKMKSEKTETYLCIEKPLLADIYHAIYLQKKIALLEGEGRDCRLLYIALREQRVRISVAIEWLLREVPF